MILSFSAAYPMDYMGQNNILSFAACETKRCVNVAIVDDLLVEPIEFFHYALERTPNLDTRISLTPVDGRLEIVDNNDGIYSMLHESVLQSSFLHRYNSYCWLRVYSTYCI